MKCYYPTTFPNSKDSLVSCGQCMACRINKKREIVTRLTLEHMTYPDALFVTLTYAPEHLPDPGFPGGSLRKTDLQKFFKRLRDRHGSFRYFAVGEYGEQSLRAHYHLCLFKININTIEQDIRKSWKLGHIQTRLFDKTAIKAMNYIAGYVTKKMTSIEDIGDGREPEFNLRSKFPGLGAGMAKAFAGKLIEENQYPMRYLSQEQRYAVRETGLDITFWDGYFMRDSKWFRMDNYMMKQIGAEVDKGIGLSNYLSQSDALDITEAQKYKAYLRRLAHESHINLYQLIKEGEFDVSKQKAQQAAQKEKDRKRTGRPL